MLAAASRETPIVGRAKGIDAELTRPRTKIAHRRVRSSFRGREGWET